MSDQKPYQRIPGIEITGIDIAGWKGLERCYACDEPTGRAGRADDSLFCAECDAGPFCEECWDQPCPTVGCSRGRESG